MEVMIKAAPSSRPPCDRDKRIRIMPSFVPPFGSVRWRWDNGKDGMRRGNCKDMKVINMMACLRESLPCNHLYLSLWVVRVSHVPIFPFLPFSYLLSLSHHQPVNERSEAGN